MKFFLILLLFSLAFCNAIPNISSADVQGSLQNFFFQIKIFAFKIEIYTQLQNQLMDTTES